ncbi:hypothetical protein LTR66_004886 [Elasticomyces elasticus]|nr:hypothetical protein LTR66_004886 [Elasticomyces elasticus]
MEGIAAGAKQDVNSIIALNVRTEIAYGLFDDGCTALAWQSTGNSYLAQNWDWSTPQKANLLALRIKRSNKNHVITMITEAGIIGKIGLNSAGVGVCLNAIKAHGISYTRMPVHLALRVALECDDRDEFQAIVAKEGVAAASHILVADALSGGLGMETSAKDIRYIVQGMKDEVSGRTPLDGIVTHTNHYLVPHRDIAEVLDLPDSIMRFQRVGELVEMAKAEGKEPEIGMIEGILKDEQGWPASINREETNGCQSETLFSVVMDLKRRKAIVKLGRPSHPEEDLELDPMVGIGDA